MKYTQEKLSEVTGISRVQLARILTGVSHPSKDSLEKLYKVLNVTDEDIVNIDFYESFSKTPEDFQDFCLYQVLITHLTFLSLLPPEIIVQDI